uniref:FYVE-type domain-containing protein n=1 Tax=Ditylenchus dipsaci TaxID=166011 RepID=A0A915E839_9BILA
MLTLHNLAACPSHLNHHQRSQNLQNRSAVLPSTSAYNSNSAHSSSSSSPSPRHHSIPQQKKMSLISNMFKGLNEESTQPSNADTSLIDYQKSEFRRYWMPDSTGRECYECKEKFSAFRRRHHCRLCGQIFCGKCSNRQVNGAELGYSGVLRLCTFCADQVEDYIVERACGTAVDPNLSVDFLDNNANTSENENPADRIILEKAHFLPANPPGPEYFLSRGRGELTIDASESSLFPIGKYTPHGSQDSYTSGKTESHYLEKQFEEKTESLLDGLLKREHLDVDVWKPLLLGLTKKVIKTVLPKMMKMPEALNVLEFIHIKKLAVKENRRKMPSYEIIRGVSFTKSLAHTSML